jgi:tight adherence protein C
MLEHIAPLLTPFSRQIVLGLVGVVLLVMCLRIFLRSRRSRRKVSLDVAPRPMRAPEAGPAIVGQRMALETKPATATRRSNPAEQVVAPLADWRGSPVADGSDYSFGPVTPMLAELLPESDERKETVTATLRNAGFYSPHAWHNLAAVRCLGIILPIIACLTMLVLVPEQFETWAVIGLVVLPLVGWSLPTLWVRSRARARVDEMNRGMPDMLDLLNMCVSQGMTVPASLSRVSREIQPVYPALSKELKIVTEQARIGSLEQALQRFSKRVDSPEIHSFTSLMIQTERMGTSMSESLTEYSDSMRESFRQRADEKANSATFKMLFPTVLCLMPAVFMFLLGPAVIELNEFFNGRGQEILDNSTAAAQLVLQEDR